MNLKTGVDKFNFQLQKRKFYRENSVFLLVAMGKSVPIKTVCTCTFERTTYSCRIPDEFDFHGAKSNLESRHVVSDRLIPAEKCSLRNFEELYG